MTRTQNRIEIRCPVGPQKLLAKLSQDNKQLVIDDSNLMELSCDWCSRELKKQGQSDRRVIHCYNFLGQLVETVTENK